VKIVFLFVCFKFATNFFFSIVTSSILFLAYFPIPVDIFLWKSFFDFFCAKKSSFDHRVIVAVASPNPYQEFILLLIFYALYPNNIFVRFTYDLSP